jgi:hypothetical protein
MGRLNNPDKEVRHKSLGDSKFQAKSLDLHVMEHHGKAVPDNDDFQINWARTPDFNNKLRLHKSYENVHLLATHQINAIRAAGQVLGNACNASEQHLSIIKNYSKAARSLLHAMDVEKAENFEKAQIKGLLVSLSIVEARLVDELNAVPEPAVH